MKRSTTSILCGIFLCVVANSSYAKDWRGIIPLRSTRSDVIRTMKQCVDHKEACRFSTDEEDVYILFSGGIPTEYRECATQLPPETVMYVSIHPRLKLKLSDLRLDKRQLRSFNASDPPQSSFKGYRSSDGLIVTLYDKRVTQIFYYPADFDIKYCPSYYARPESFVTVVLLHVPVIDAVCAVETIKAGEILKVSANSHMNETRGYTWQVTAGQKIAITAEIDDGLYHTASASCVVSVLPN